MLHPGGGLMFKSVQALRQRELMRAVRQKAEAAHSLNVISSLPISATVSGQEANITTQRMICLNDNNNNNNKYNFYSA